MSPHMLIFKPSRYPILLLIVRASNKAWVGCSCLPSPALIILQLKYSANRSGAPLWGCLTINKSGFIAFKVLAVSNKLSPFFIDELIKEILITSAPSLLAASSNETLVRVEFSKKTFSTTYPDRYLVSACLSKFAK